MRAVLILVLAWGASAQVYPGAAAQDKDVYVAVAGVLATLTGAVSATATTFSVSSTANMQPYELLVVDGEVVEECSAAGGTIQIGKNSCPGADGRGIGGSNPASHQAGARIQDLITGEHHNTLRREVKAIETALGPNLSNVPGSPAGPPVPISKGGTGATTQGAALSNILGTTPALHSVCFGEGAAPMICLGPGPTGTVLASNGPGFDPSWQMGGAGGVSTVFGRTGAVVATMGDYTAAQVINAADTSQAYANPAWITSLAWPKITGAPAFITNPMSSAGDFIVGGTGGVPQRLAVPGTGTFCPNWAAGVVTWVTCPGGGGGSGLTSVGITMPAAFNVSGSPLTSNGVIAVTGAGTAAQYITGQGLLATLPVSSVFGRSTGAITAQTGDYTTAQVTESGSLYFTNARVYASLSATTPIVFNATTGNISCPTCGTGTGGGTITSVFGRTGPAIVAATGDYAVGQVTNAESVLNKDTNGGYVGRDTSGNVTIPGTITALMFASSDTTHTSLVAMNPGLSSNFAQPIPAGNWGLYLDSSNSNKLTRQDSLGNKVVIEGAGGGGGAPYVQSFTSQTTVALTHNLGLTNVIAFNIDCFDTGNNLIFPSTVTATNANTVTVTFAVATSGSCTVTTGGTGAGGGGGGGSVFTGSTAVTSTFSATPTFSLADVSVKSPVRFEPGQLTANVTAVTFTGKTAGAKFSIVWVQGTGAYTVTYGASVTSGNPCGISPTASIWTEQFFEVAADGASVYATTCSTNETAFAILGAPERMAPATAATGAANLWPDPTRHTWTGTENGSTNQHIMPRCAGTTDQCASADLSDTANIGLLNAVQTYTAAKTFTGATTLGATTFSGITGSSQCLHVSTAGLVSGTGVDCGSGGGGASITGTATLGTTAIAANACAAVVSVTATGLTTSMALTWTPTADISPVTGYGVASTDGLKIYAYPTANTANFKVCNATAASITPGAATLNWAANTQSTVYAGAQALGTGAVAANTCATALTLTATGVLTTDAVAFSSAADWSAITGYGVAATDGLKVYVWPTANTVNIKQCNGTGTSITPGAATLNVRVIR